MKLVIVGASGFVATEVVRQSLQHPKVDEVVALARRPVPVPTGRLRDSDALKFRSVVISDYETYTDDVKSQLADADACIWTVAITPTKSKNLEFSQVRKVCHDYTMIGLKAIFEASDRKPDTPPLRFMYMSGIAAERDQTKTPSFMPQYSLLRGETENDILKFAAEHPGRIEACAAKPGLIRGPNDYLKLAFGTVLKWTMGVPNILVTDIAAAMIDQVVNGFEKEPLLNDDLVAIGQRVQQAS